MAKILILNPPSEVIFFKEDLRCQNDADELVHHILRPPIMLMYLAGIAEKSKYLTKIIDAPVERVTLEQLIKFLQKWQPDWVAANTSVHTLESDMKILQLAKEKGAKTISFGYAASIPDTDIMKGADFIDFLIRGEPEKAFQELLEGKIPLNQIRGLTYRDNGLIKRNDDRDFIENLDDLPFPAHHLINHKLYRVPTTGELFTTIQTSKGCPNHCTFCLSNLLNGPKVRKRSVESIIEEIKMVTQNLKKRSFFFRADTFTYNKRWVLKLCNEIIKNKLKIKWFCNSRVDTVDEEMLNAMKKAGCYYICFGLESGNAEILKYIRKGITKEQAIKAIDLAKRAGIITGAVYIIGLPKDTLNTVHETINYSKKVDSDLAEFIPFMQFPGAESTSQTTPNMDPAILKKLRQYAFIQFYFRPKMVVRLIRDFYLGIAGFTQLFYVLWTSMKTMTRIFRRK